MGPPPARPPRPPPGLQPCALLALLLLLVSVQRGGPGWRALALEEAASARQLLEAVAAVGPPQLQAGDPQQLRRALEGAGQGNLAVELQGGCARESAGARGLDRADGQGCLST